MPKSINSKAARTTGSAASRGWRLAIALTSSSTAALALQYSITDLGTFPGGTFSFANDIHASGLVVGYGDTANGETHAFVYNNGGLIDLGTLGGGMSVAQSILDDGTILGYSAIATGQLHAFSYDGQMLDLGPISGSIGTLIQSGGSTSALGGYTDAGGFHQAYLDEGGVLVELGTLGGRFSYALDLGASGDIVGYSETADLTQSAFIYRESQMLNLNDLIPPDSGWVLRSATAINEQGQIVGYGIIDGQTRGFLLDVTVPEADTWAAVVSIALIAGGIWRRRRP